MSHFSKEIEEALEDVTTNREDITNWTETLDN